MKTMSRISFAILILFTFLITELASLETINAIVLTIQFGKLLTHTDTTLLHMLFVSVQPTTYVRVQRHTAQFTS